MNAERVTSGMLLLAFAVSVLPVCLKLSWGMKTAMALALSEPHRILGRHVSVSATVRGRGVQLLIQIQPKMVSYAPT